MPFLCNRCGAVRDTLSRTTERHPYGDSFAEENMPDTRCFCGGEFEPAVTCRACGELKREEDNFFYEGFCDDCLKEKAKDLKLVTKCAKAYPNKTTVEVDDLLVYLLSPETVNGILWDYFTKCCESQSFGFLLRDSYAKKAEEWATADLLWFAEALDEEMKNEQDGA